VALEHPDPDELAALKKRGGSRVSVVIPARDEEATVGEVAGQLVASLQRRTGLVDEVLVVDADSSDRTGAVAAQAGARVVRQADVLPELGTHIGKGETMWKGLAASTGDLVVFVNADIVGIDERFVTELLARPLLAALWPELAWLTQPLAGECVARRSLLESLPFVRGYGVEFAMLPYPSSRQRCARWIWAGANTSISPWTHWGGWRRRFCRSRCSGQHRRAG
jgi:glucosyl-3-phosphoglycerate synthase